MTLDSEPCEIVNLKEFLEENLQKKVLNYSLSSFTKVGDHYGSVIKRLIVEALDDQNVSCGFGSIFFFCCEFKNRIFFFLEYRNAGFGD